MIRSSLFFIFFISAISIFTSQNASAQSFLPGEITLKDGTVQKGTIKFMPARIYLFRVVPSAIIFKTDGARQKYKPENLSGFKVNKKRYVVLENFQAHTQGSKFKADFVEVIQEGVLDLYPHHGIVYIGNLGVYTNRYILVNSEGKNLGIHRIQDQREEVSAMFDDSHKIQQTILTANHKEIDIPKLVWQYNDEF